MLRLLVAGSCCSRPPFSAHPLIYFIYGFNFTVLNSLGLGVNVLAYTCFF